MRFSILAAIASTLLACGGRPPATPASAPESEPAGREAAVTSEPRAAASTPAGSSDDRPAGDLVCRAVNDTGKATELFLEWDGSEAVGVLREIAPSGMVYKKNVRAERHQGMVIADDVHEKDVVVHAAVVAERGGKKVMKVDDAWSTCQ